VHLPAVGTLYNTKDQRVKASEPSYSTRNTTQDHITEWSHHAHDHQGLPEWQNWDYHPCYQLKQPTAIYHGLYKAEDTHKIKNNHNNITSAPRQTTWQDHLAQDHNTWSLSYASQPTKVMRTTKEIMTAAKILCNMSLSNIKETWKRNRSLHHKGSHQRCETPKRSHQRCGSKRQYYGQRNHRKS
jgi:hypothetical protein